MSLGNNAGSAVVSDARATTSERPPAGDTRMRGVAQSVGPAVAILVAQLVLFPAPAAIVLQGFIVGGLTALVALGMALIYRSNRILNFAQADLGFAPTVVAFLLLTESGVPYPLAVLAGLVIAVALGATTERVVIRRFVRSPRLLVTIATIGLSQVLAAVALLVPRLWDTDAGRRAHRAPVRPHPPGRHAHVQRQRPAGPRGHAGGGGAGRPVPAGQRRRRRHPGERRLRPSGRRCSACRWPGCRRWCGRSPRPWPSPPCSFAAASSSCPRAPPWASACCSGRWPPSCSAA